MVAAKTLQYEVNKLLGRINTSYESDINAVDLDAYINNAKDLVLSRVDKLVEKNRIFQRDFADLLEIDKVLKLKNSDNKLYSIYSLPKDYYDYTRLSGFIKLNNCEVKLETLLYVQQDDLNEALKDPNIKPSWGWRSGIYYFKSDKELIFYHDNEYDVSKILISYIRYLNDIATPSNANGEYIKSDGITVVKEDKGLDLRKENILWRKIVQIAAYLIHKDLDKNFKPEIDSIIFNDKLGII